MLTPLPFLVKTALGASRIAGPPNAFGHVIDLQHDARRTIRHR